jgi:hypothetical protein
LGVASKAIAKYKGELAAMRAGQNARAAIARANNQAQIASLRKTVSTVRQNATSSITMAMGFVVLGAVAGSQVARMTILKNTEGISRARWLNYGAGLVSAAALLTGRIRSQDQLNAAAFGVGMGLSQTVLKSFTEWDLVPGDYFDT